MAVLSPARIAAWLALAGLAACAAAPALAPRLRPDGRLHLRHLAPAGCVVSVVGDFNGWTPGADPLAPGDGAYEADLALPPGAHLYAFAQGCAGLPVQIVAPEQAPAYVQDDFGGRDGLIQIPPRP